MHMSEMTYMMGERQMTAIQPTTTIQPTGLRIGDAERQAAVALLQRHYVAGRLDEDELGDRVGRALAAWTSTDLRALFDDLPPIRAEATERAAPVVAAWSAPTDPGFRAHLTSYLLVMGLLLGIWLLTTPGG